jgi:hypothetical protein
VETGSAQGIERISFFTEGIVCCKKDRSESPVSLPIFYRIMN